MSSPFDPTPPPQLPPPPEFRARRSAGTGGSTGLRVLLGVVLVVVALVLAQQLGVVDLRRGVASDPSTASVPADSPPPSGHRVEVAAACIDPTASSGAAFARQVRDDLAASVDRWYAVPGSSGDLRDGFPARPGLDLTVRMVSTHSSATDQETVQVVLPEVLGLPPAPAASDPDYGQHSLDWSRARTDLEQARASADVAARDGATAIRALVLDRETTSGISGCLAAAAASTPGDAGRLLLASDLDENRPAEPADLRGWTVTILQSCPAGSETECEQRAAAWSERLRDQNAVDVRVVRADSPQALGEWIRP